MALLTGGWRAGHAVHDEGENAPGSFKRTTILAWYPELGLSEFRRLYWIASFGAKHSCSSVVYVSGEVASGASSIPLD